MDTNINFRIEIQPDKHKGSGYYITVNNRTHTYSDDYTEQLHRALTALLAVGGIHASEFVPEHISPKTTDSLLKETVDLMLSSDYKDRLLAEYKQLSIRRNSLCNMLEKWKDGTLGFTPKAPQSAYIMQLDAMNQYIASLEIRAVIENIQLN